LKIEVGESLALSWLRHVRGCQVVQINWKATPDILVGVDDGPLRPVFDAIRRGFDEAADPLPVVKKTSSLKQWLQQGEVDALGLKLLAGRVEDSIAVDIAFHERGLQYGSKTETSARVAKKLLRTALLLRGPLALEGGTVVFASPKVSPATTKAVLAGLERVRAFASEVDVLRSVSFDVLIGDGFREQMLDPVLATANDVADTSELFLRSVQLVKLFDR
jgi:hypothetical protein